MGLYANTDSAETRFRLALKYQLKQITKGNGYKNDIGDIFDRIPTRNQVQGYPAVVIVFGKENILNEDMSDQLWHKEVPLVLLAMVMDNADAPLARETLKQDIEHRLGNYWQLPTAEGVESCFVLRLTGSEPFGMLLNEPRVGVAIGLKVQYRQDILDPSVAG